MRGGWYRPILALVAAGVTVSGCGLFGSREPDPSALRSRAQDVLATWSAAVAAGGGSGGFVPVGELTGQIGDWELDVGGNNKVALMAGAIDAAKPLPPEVPPDGTVTWSDGTASTFPLVSAAEAVAAVKADGAGGCDGCTPLRVTAAALGSVSVATSRGPAVAPVWEFSLQGTAVVVTRLAIAHAVRVRPPSTGSSLAAGISVESASVSSDGRVLTVGFTGAPEDAGGGCGADYTAEAVESEIAVAAIVLEHPKGGGFGACSAVGARRTASVELASPLGDRTVLDVITGQPVGLEGGH